MKPQRILVCGASGFVGRNLLKTLSAAGHTCIKGVRRPAKADERAVDYTRDLSVAAWKPKLEGIDAVINAVGVLRDTRQKPMQLIHAEAPAALFAACAEFGVKRIVNISALGVDSSVPTQYFTTKAVAEHALFSLDAPVYWLNLRPSVIYGQDGDSAKLFRLLAQLPVHCLPMGGRQLMQPVHISDIAEAVCKWLAKPEVESASITVTGADVVSMRAMLDSYRRQLGHGAALHIPVPGVFIRTAAWLGNFVPFSPLCSETLLMLEAGSTGDNQAFAQLLGRAPLSVHAFIAGTNPARL